jgi:hypothetical protein
MVIISTFKVEIKKHPTVLSAILLDDLKKIKLNILNRAKYNNFVGFH